MSGVLEKTNEFVVCLESIFESYQRETQTRGRGRPKLSITEEQLLHLLQSHFTLCDIAALFGCSVRTIHRRVTEFGLAEALHTVLSDSDLDGIVGNFVQVHPINGQRMLVGHLRSLGLRVPRQRVRYSLLRVDPQGVSLHRRQALHRREYSVPGPNSLWHVDGYHKLI